MENQPNIASKDCYSVPFEWFDYEDPSGKTSEQRQVLVVWLNESQFVDSPLKGIKDFLDNLLSGVDLTKQALRATLLGPGRSDALRKLAINDESEAFEWLRDHPGLSEFNIISSTATVADDDLIGEWSPQVIPKKPTASPLIKRYQEFSGEHCNIKSSSPPLKKTCMRFLRTIQSDEALIEKLAAELKENRLVSAEKDYVVVISEWDTYFGRFLPRAFTKHFCAPNCENVLRFSYQRGMDGILAGKQNLAKASQNPSKAGASSPSIDVTSMRRPVGTAQFDYLRRLAADIQNKDNELRLSTGHGVRAVVLLGSDVYDKLLILRALRPELPGALFATTDLDAQLLHPAEYKWARSLIIASTYDFRLSSQIPMTTMPFRDSYQTSVYLATRLAFNSNLMPLVTPDCNQSGAFSSQGCKTIQQRIYEKIPAQLFEVGRQSLVRLSTNESNDNSWNLVTTQSFAAPVALGLVALAVLGIIALHQLRPMAGRVVAVSSFILLLFALMGLGIIMQGPAGEPLALMAGASIWPTEYIRLLSVVLALVFIWIVVHRLHRNWCELGARYFWGGCRNS